jgi:hypothetical protein
MGKSKPERPPKHAQKEPEEVPEEPSGETAAQDAHLEVRSDGVDRQPTLGSAKIAAKKAKLAKRAALATKRGARAAQADPQFAAGLTKGSRFRPLQAAAARALQGLAVRSDEIMAEAAAGEDGTPITADAAVSAADAAADVREPAAARKPVGERPASGARPAKKPKADPLDADPVVRAAKTALQHAFMRNVHAPSPKNQKALDRACPA